MVEVEDEVAEQRMSADLRELLEDPGFQPLSGTQRN